MHKKSTFKIKNRYGLTIVGDVYIPQKKHKPDSESSKKEKATGCSFVEHGLAGTRYQTNIMTMVETLLINNYVVVNFDATNSIGESAGSYEHATMQLHYEDLCDVIFWASTEPWYKEPFILAGHSLGGYAVARYAEEYPEKVKALFPHALVVSGKLSFDATEKNEPGKLETWKETGWYTRKSPLKPDLELRLPWSHMEERLGHDLEPKASKLTMPVLLMVGEKDKPCPPEQQQLFFYMLLENVNNKGKDQQDEQHKNEFHIVDGAGHTFKEEEHLKQLASIFDAWLKKL